MGVNGARIGTQSLRNLFQWRQGQGYLEVAAAEQLHFLHPSGRRDIKGLAELLSLMFSFLLQHFSDILIFCNIFKLNKKLNKKLLPVNISVPCTRTLFLFTFVCGYMTCIYYQPGRQLCVCLSHLHLLMPWLELPANHGSRMNIHRQVSLRLIARKRAGLSESRRPRLNQWTECFSFRCEEEEEWRWW